MQADCELENGSSEVINNVMTTVISELKNLKKVVFLCVVHIMMNCGTATQ